MPSSLSPAPWRFSGAAIESRALWSTRRSAASTLRSSTREPAPLRCSNHEASLDLITKNASGGYTVLYQPRFAAPKGLHETLASAASVVSSRDETSQPHHGSAASASTSAHKLDREVHQFTDFSPDLLFVELDPSTEFQTQVLVIVDCKASPRVKLEHRVQIAMYSILLEPYLAGHPHITLAAVGGVWLAGELKPRMFELAGLRQMLKKFLADDVPSILPRRGPCAAAWRTELVGLGFVCAVGRGLAAPLLESATMALFRQVRVVPGNQHLSESNDARAKLVHDSVHIAVLQVLARVLGLG